MTKNKDSSRFYSNLQETKVANLIDGNRSPNSGASLFYKSDVYQDDASIVIECKTPETKKESFSIKKEWITKCKKEAFEKRYSNTAIAITFEPNTENYFLIDERLFKYLVDKLKEEYK